MKLNGLNYSIPLLGALFSLTHAEVHAGAMGPTEVVASTKVYFGVFGGGGSSNRVEVDQYGTAFYPESSGGPLAVDAFGRTRSRSVGIVGGQVGYQWTESFLNALNMSFGFSPVAELEGFYMGKGSFRAHAINNTIRLPEHDFEVTYPTQSGVFLANAILNFNATNYTRLHPYVGAGIGGAVLSIHDANSLQVAPPEEGVNHYNSNPDDKAATFAGQVKVGLNFDISEHLNVFAEYRWLYLASSSFTFGSTNYSFHVPTSSWAVNLGPQQYNLGAAGIRFTI